MKKLSIERFLLICLGGGLVRTSGYFRGINAESWMDISCFWVGWLIIWIVIYGIGE